MNKLVENLLIYIPLSILIFLAGIYLGGEIWVKGKIVLGDLLKLFGWAGKNVRKYSVESEYEGTINSIIQDYNKNFESSILPNCKIEWVNANNQQNILNENEAIICLSFDKKDHNLNFYNATLNFVQTALIAKAKDYLAKPSSKAIDLLTTHIILRNNRKEVLTTFRKKLNDFDEVTKQEFEQLVPTNERGLFLNLLLPEFHFYGELIDTLPPSSDYHIEANGLLNWFKELATREIDDRTNLKFVSKNFKIGVILVGKDETWETQGAAAYTKWADYYASENFNSVYILARGNNGFDRATQVTKILTNSKGFDQLNKNPKIKCITAEGLEYIVTCYSLRPNKATIAYLAWENFKEHHKNNENVPAIVDFVQKESVIVNVFGLKFDIPNKLMSEIEISDCRKVFRPENELYLTIVEFNSDRQHILLSNRGTISDPKHYIDAVIEESKIYPCKVERIKSDKQGIQIGIMVSNPELKSWIFIPKYYATPSRFIDLSSKFELGKELNVSIESYNSFASNFVGKIEDIINPWESPTIKKLQAGDIIEVEVKQITELFIVCELIEGLECGLTKQEISWEKAECQTTSFQIDDKIKVKVISIDVDKKRINVSIKRLIKTPELEYFEEHANKIVDVEIFRVVDEKGIAVKYPGCSNTGFIHWFEIGWGAIGRFELIFKEGQKLKALVYEFDADKNSIKFSLKRKYKHEFEKWNSVIKADESVIGKIVAYFDNCAQIELKNNGFTVQAFIFRKNISNFAFVEQEDLTQFLPLEESFGFFIDNINEDKQIISLSRLEYLALSEELDYGEKIDVKYVKENHVKGYFYSDDYEGWINIQNSNIIIGSSISVIPVKLSTGEFQVV